MGGLAVFEPGKERTFHEEVARRFALRRMGGGGGRGGGRGASTSTGVASDDREQPLGRRLNFKQLISSETPGLRRRLACCSECAVAKVL